MAVENLTLSMAVDQLSPIVGDEAHLAAFTSSTQLIDLLHRW